ncbi:DUF6634 family protein [Tardiphaga robiniae]|uniref:DUF6634 family protein n=1 Tax=Tardiphaga robiniae TaxID=943830 RepID=UPI00308422DA
MLIRAFPFLDPRRIPSGLSERLQSLAADCALLERNPAFVSARLRTAPILDRYSPVLSPLGLQLVGDVTGHPQLGSRKIVTSQVWFADPEDRWVRTLSRFYRLGRPGESDPRSSPSTFRPDDDDDDGWPGAGH